MSGEPVLVEVAPTMPDVVVAPDRIMLFPAGPDIPARDGRAWRLSDPNGVVAAFERHGAPLPIDFEHSQDHRAPKGEEAPAVGWIESVTADAENGAVWADVKWTEAGRKAVETRAYRFISPTFNFNPVTTEIVSLVGAALVNRPALYLPALAAEEQPRPDAALMAALGLPLAAGVHDALARLATMRGELARATAAAEAPSLDRFVPRPDHDALLARAIAAVRERIEIGTALGLDAEATAAQAVAAVGCLRERLSQAQAAAASPPIERFVPRAEHDQALARAMEAEDRVRTGELLRSDEEMVRLVDGAIADGRITPASREDHLANCRAEGGVERFKSLVAKLPRIVGGGRDLGEVGGATAAVGLTGGALSDTERAVCDLMGVSPDAFNRARRGRDGG